MSECLILPKEGGRKEIYKTIIPQISSLVEHERDVTANLANIAAILKEALGFFWVGFYVAKDNDELVLAPFQGPLACTRIRKGKGVCGTVYAQGVTIIVNDVEEFPGHIACSSLSRSEIVVPIIMDGTVWGVLDVDSKELGDFDETDKQYLQEIVSIIVKLLK